MNWAQSQQKEMKKANVYMYDKLAGTLIEDENGFHFQYDPTYLKSKAAEPISLTLPLTDTVYESGILFPFFDGLIPEGWLLDIANKNWKLDPRDRMEVLLNTCRDCIGAVSIESIP